MNENDVKMTVDLDALMNNPGWVWEVKEMTAEEKLVSELWDAIRQANKLGFPQVGHQIKQIIEGDELKIDSAINKL